MNNTFCFHFDATARFKGVRSRDLLLQKALSRSSIFHSILIHLNFTLFHLPIHLLIHSLHLTIGKLGRFPKPKQK